MNIDKLEVGMFQVNCYIVRPSSSCKDVLIIDPGDEGDRIVEFIRSHGYRPLAVLLTHAHLDHIKGTKVLADAFGLSVYVPKHDMALFESDLNELAPYLYRDCEFPAITPLSEFDYPGLKVLDTPGHTLGGSCFYFAEDGVLFSGDTIFQHSIGRTDLPGGDLGTLLDSINREIMTLPEETVIYPGHGASTSVKSERDCNQFIA
jgi:glyoxylase-like metal-dependent hydrolase (beta-lactamase superfamily II)